MLSHSFHIQVSDANWRDPDLSVLDGRRRPVPAVPLALLPQPWRDWIADTERSTGAPADYVLQSVLAGVAAVCGAGVRVRVTPAWDEPLVLWLAAVGEPWTGKSAALAPMRRLLDVIEQERRLGDEERRAAMPSAARRTERAVALRVLADRGDRRRSRRAGRRSSPAIRVACCCGATGPTAWIGGEDGRRWPSRALARGLGGRAVTVTRPRQPARVAPAFPVSILETVRPERLKASLEAAATTAWPRASCSPGPARSPTARWRSSSARATRRSCSACARCRGWATGPTILT